ncbi:uncharacterized protein K02A2.6-like [Trichonephila clavipes]|nr:uncharacterized protein K02A2.6-like [Trichonephila clavipes]
MVQQKEKQKELYPTRFKIQPQIEVSDASPQPFVFAITDDIPKFDIDPEIPKQTRNDVEALLVSYRPNKTKTTDIELSITVTNDKPIYYSPRWLPFTERDIVDKQIDEWTQNGIIEPCSSALYGGSAFPLT